MAAFKDDFGRSEKNKVFLNMPRTFIKQNRQTLDLPETTANRRAIIKQKYFLGNYYRESYRKIKRLLSPASRSGMVIELGSGAGFIKEIIPEVKTSDILKLSAID